MVVLSNETHTGDNGILTVNWWTRASWNLFVKLDLQHETTWEDSLNNSYLCTYDLHDSCVMFLMRAYTLQGQVGGGWALEIESFLGPVKCHQADRRVPFGAQKTLGGGAVR